MNLKKPVTTHILAAAVLAALALGGCTNAEPAKDTGSAPAAGISVDDAAAGLVPQKIKDAGVLKVGIDAT
jgi:ABC-type amino acid transport substrate-binding protein